LLSGYGILFGITESMRMEQLTDKDKIVGIATHPLEQYFDTLKARPRFFFVLSAFCRRYAGSWEIDDGKLFLTDFIDNWEEKPNVKKTGGLEKISFLQVAGCI
jgi:hypothetical protein